MKRWLTGLVLVGGQALAQAPWPDFDACMNSEVARFEDSVLRVQDAGLPPNHDMLSVIGVDYCGSLGIASCDRTPAPFACQRDLAQIQETLRWRVLASLPQPDIVAAKQEVFEAPLYPKLLAMAHDKSAGPDCAGAAESLAAWCEAREANRRLASAVLAWQLARAVDVALPAVEAGWAREPEPMRPVARDGSE